jgi:hypothetical protein
MVQGIGGSVFDLSTRPSSHFDMKNLCIHTATLGSTLPAYQLIDIQLVAIFGHVYAAGNAQDSHVVVVRQAREKLWRDEKVLACMLFTCNLDHSLVHHAFVARVHTLVDLIDNTEGSLRHGLQGHDVKHCRYSTLTTRLAMLVEQLKLFIGTAQFLLKP